MNSPRHKLTHLGALSLLSVVLCGGCFRSNSHSPEADGGLPDVATDTPTFDVATIDTATRPPDVGFAVCEQAADCVLLPVSCCGSCGQPTRDDIQSVHRERISEVREDACADPVVCPACARPPDPDLVPDCSMGSCTYLDLQERTHLNGCDTDADCVVRYAPCCECGADPMNLVSLNRDALGSYVQAVCGGGLICDDCDPPPPAAEPFCDNNRCALR